MTAIDERPAVGYRHLVQDAPRDFRVHTSLYTDPAIFAAEMERIFERGWVYVGHTSEVAAPGTYKTTHMGRQPVIVTRDDVGTIHVLLNVCRHRGAAVCRDAAGQATTFQCPYHGWCTAIAASCWGSPVGMDTRRSSGGTSRACCGRHGWRSVGD